MLDNILQTVMLAARNLARQRRRGLLALLTVCGGVVAYLLAGGFIEWIFHDMRESTIHSQLGHIQITRPGYFSNGVSDPYRYLLPGATDEVARLGGDKVRTISPRLAFNGLISREDATVSFVGEGIDPALERPISRAITIVSGRDLADGDANEVLLGEGLAANLGAAAGDSVVLLATTAEGGINAVELKVAGLFATITKSYDDSVLRAPIGVARRLMRVEGATTWVVLLGDTAETAAATASLRRSMPAASFEITPWNELADFYNKTVELFSRQVGVVRALIALIVVLSISNTLSMAVIERTSEIGTSMALGVRRRGILGLFLCEGALLGIAGGLLGVALGLVLAEAISLVGIPMPPPPGMARGYLGQIAVTPALALDALLLAFVTTLVASLFPAWKASRMQIVDALRHQG
ncbi:ABC transporter permease [Thauera sinica]|uniref:ABC transporter permease n=1 Tax=Thauera sinica TaxID=2665146 RepID=A0ABW1ALA0_9RHOO|nr:FtsX-like permease family protein [Thauera sp. K11]ATE59117.1 ABC transporter permease [Thauera sp. K11]